VRDGGFPEGLAAATRLRRSLCAKSAHRVASSYPPGGDPRTAGRRWRKTARGRRVSRLTRRRRTVRRRPPGDAHHRSATRNGGISGRYHSERATPVAVISSLPGRASPQQSAGVRQRRSAGAADQARPGKTDRAARPAAGFKDPRSFPEPGAAPVLSGMRRMRRQDQLKRNRNGECGEKGQSAAPLGRCAASGRSAAGRAEQEAVREN
jgi:hypothetical protein